VKANRQATARIRTCVDYESEEPDSHIGTFRGIKTGIIITLILFWLPFIVLSYLFGWLYLLAYGILLVAIFTALGLVSRYYGLLRSIVHSKPSAEAIGS
jgi:hypothetical protein